MIKFENTKREISQKDIQNLEEEFMVVLPESYKEHVLKNNGGRPVHEMYDGIRIHYFHSIKYGEFGTLENSLRTLMDVLPNGFSHLHMMEGEIK